MGSSTTFTSNHPFLNKQIDRNPFRNKPVNNNPFFTTPFATDPAGQNPSFNTPSATNAVGQGSYYTVPSATNPACHSSFFSQPIQCNPLEVNRFNTNPFDTTHIDTDRFETKPLRSNNFLANLFNVNPLQLNPFAAKTFENKPSNAEPFETEPLDTKPFERKTSTGNLGNTDPHPNVPAFPLVANPDAQTLKAKEMGLAYGREQREKARTADAIAEAIRGQCNGKPLSASIWAPGNRRPAVSLSPFRLPILLRTNRCLRHCGLLAPAAPRSQSLWFLHPVRLISRTTRHSGLLEMGSVKTKSRRQTRKPRAFRLD
ncbi:hypothetical protein QBC35DRAFT_452399 [Podospora australis]|uniref:Uncharacterized protein n=1 Tax=Podospora australis TaxID=1536484 RepID=A0AAN7AHG3_9PEZI|nr:hypothetical protein QBC35DRAFT_452399 [Podospora australis]